MYNERDWRKSRTTRRTGKENEFYAKPNNGDIIEPKESRPPSISQIKDGIKAAETNLDNMQRQQWNTIISGATDDQVITAQSRVDSAKEELKKYNLQLTTAYGLDDDGYWNKPQTARSTQMNANPEHAYAIGNSTNAASKPISADTRSAKPANTPPKTTARSMQMKANPEHAYAIGNSTTAASKPISAYSRGTKPATAQPMKTRSVTPGKTVKPVSTTQHDMKIAQLQDELVNTPMISEQKKWKIEDEITKLTAERDVLKWKNSHPVAPTVENHETQMRYFDDLWNQNQDVLVNGLGNDTVRQGSDEWYALLKKGDDILEQRNAYNKGMMGLLDGQKAVTAQESAAAQTGGSRSVGLTANNQQAEKVSASYDTGMLHAYGNWSSEVGGTPNPEEGSGGVPLPGINNANSTAGRETVSAGEQKLKITSEGVIPSTGQIIKEPSVWDGEIIPSTGQKIVPQESTTAKDLEDNMQLDYWVNVQPKDDSNLGDWLSSIDLSKLGFRELNQLKKIEEEYLKEQNDKQIEEEMQAFIKMENEDAQTFFDNAIISANYGNYSDLESIITFVYKGNGKPEGATFEDVNRDFLDYSFDSEKMSELAYAMQYKRALLEEEILQTTYKKYQPYIDADEEKEIPELTENVVSVLLSEEGGLDDEFRTLIRKGIGDVQVENLNVLSLTKEEALELYYEEKEKSISAVTTFAGLTGTVENPLQLVSFIYNELAGGDDLSQKMLDELLNKENYDMATINKLIDNDNLIETKVKDQLKGVLGEIGIKAIMELGYSMHDDINNIIEGEYVEVDVNIWTSRDEDLMQPFQTSTLRLIKKDGRYIYDTDNPLCMEATSLGK